MCYLKGMGAGANGVEATWADTGFCVRGDMETAIPTTAADTTLGNIPGCTLEANTDYTG